jgi:protein-L-isoaspartate(D-aspartate) O-methyltransferase
MSPDFADQRKRMVVRQLAGRGIRDERVLRAMGIVPRELFVARSQRPYAYDDGPLPIGEGQTISQPYVVALMLEKLQLAPGNRLLEVGTGSGYAAAVASHLAREVYTIERHGRLAARASEHLKQAGCANVQVRHGNGYSGWPAHAPFDAILVSAGSTDVPPALIGQLIIGGRLVIPVGRARYDQRLLRLTRTGDEAHVTESLEYVAFVPLVDEEAEGAYSPDSN